LRNETQRIATRKPLIAEFRKLNPAYPLVEIAPGGPRKYPTIGDWETIGQSRLL